MEPALEKGCIVHMHSDGDIRTLVDDIIDDGVQVINLQDLVNGIDWIADKFRGRRCVELDIDRQLVTVSGTPKDITGGVWYTPGFVLRRKPALMCQRRIRQC